MIAADPGCVRTLSSRLSRPASARAKNLLSLPHRVPLCLGPALTLVFYKPRIFQPALIRTVGGFVPLRVFAIILVLSATAAAASHRPVCPGPAAAGTARCHAHVITDERGNPNANLAASGYGPAQFRTAYALPSTTNGKGQTIAIVDAYN